MNVSDNLIESCKLNNRKSQQDLYKLLLPYLRAVAYRYLRDTSFVKDVLQESFVKIFKNIHQYNPNKAPLKNWAAQIVVNDCLNYNKRIIGEANEEFDLNKHEIICLPQVVEESTDEHLLVILKQMPVNYFAVFNLYVIDGYKHLEIAKMLGITITLSRKRLSRAREWLKKTFNSKDKTDQASQTITLPKNKKQDETYRK